jgi:photosystem II stability/assembly factor-like uncharacterized protein
VLAALLLLACATEAQPSPSTPYIWRNAVIGGGGFVTGIITHPRQKGLMYARTDVGGAYRWDDTAQSWIALTDWIGPADGNLTGIESLAVDPADPTRLYLAAGTYSSGPAAIFRSTDQGRTFQWTHVPFKMGGNELGRFNGERLAVDPNQGQVLFFGSRRDGLWKSGDYGTTWQKVEGFPAVASAKTPAATPSRPWSNFGQQPVGIVSVVFDPASGRPGSPTRILYAAVSTDQTNLYRSIDAGVSWQPVPNQPVGLRPNHLVFSPDRMVYLSYGREPGPNTITDGAIWKYNVQDGIWTDITPLKPANADQPFGYGGLSVDGQHPQTIVAATFAHWKPLDEIFRSTNGGVTWTPLLSRARWDHSAAPYTRDRKPHWIGDLEINPFDSDQAIFITGYGVWCCTNMTRADLGRPTDWVFLDRGLEETVPLALLSPSSGAHLLSGIGDVDGFRHDDLAVSPANGSFAGPRFSNTEDLALAGANPQIIARTGTGRDAPVHAAISTDGGNHWRALASEPPNSAGAGSIALSADGRTIVWTPRRSAPHYTTNLGKSWTPCAGLSVQTRVIADTVNPARFYAFDERAGRLWVSTNSAAVFVSTEATFPTVEGFSGFGSGGGNNSVAATPGIEGDIWLASRHNGLCHSTNGGAGFTRLGSVEEAYSLGFGKPASEKSFPTLYLAGKIDQVRALFRSEDAGQTWVRINDDQHQYGSMSRVTGDPRIFGRVYFATGGRGIIYGDPAPAKPILTSSRFGTAQSE